ncbi:MAG: T9SS type A sorting domain-containing protein [Ignavibacteria bacterium]|nr:T9SS type A sorting domain-containing protein [Ignavibacteria bacterium]
MEFQIAQDGFVNIALYDLMGQKIKDIVNDFRKAGKYLIQLNASDLSSGVYFYKMNVNNFSQTRKLIVIK